MGICRSHVSLSRGRLWLLPMLYVRFVQEPFRKVSGKKKREEKNKRIWDLREKRHKGVEKGDKAFLESLYYLFEGTTRKTNRQTSKRQRAQSHNDDDENDNHKADAAQSQAHNAAGGLFKRPTAHK